MKEEHGLSWDQLTDLVKSSITNLNIFFCGLHVLVHTAETATASLQQAECGLLETVPPIHDTTFRKGNEPGCLRLVRTVSKAFSSGGDKRNGAHGPFSVYIKPFLKDNAMLSMPIERFKGNRFNILFSNAAGVYFLIPKIKEFFHGNDSNRLLKSVKFDVNKNELIAGCKAL